MARYTVYTQIKSNAPHTKLFYDMQLYREDNGTKFYALHPTGKHQIQADYTTQKHQTLDIPDKEETNFILSVMLYRKAGTEYIQVLSEPATSIIPLKGFTSTDPFWGKSRNNVCYLETSQKTQKSINGEVNVYKLQISCKERIFIAKEHPIGDPLDPFTKEKIEKELKIRMTKPFQSYVFDLSKTASENGQLQYYHNQVGGYPNQAASMFCGAAAFFFCVQKDRPDLYQQMIEELSETGQTKIGALEIKPGNGVKRPKNFFNRDDNNRLLIPTIDWITLGSLRDTENNLMSISSPSADWTELWWNHGAAITMWGVVEKWFIKAGTSKKFDNISLTHSNLKDVCQLNSYINSDTHVVTLIGAGMLNSMGSQFKNHWIVWEDKLRLLNGSKITTSTKLSEKVQLTLFSWGEVKNSIRWGLTLGEFLKYIYGGMVFTKIP